MLKTIEKQFREDFHILNNYVVELKVTNPCGTVVVVSERKNSDEYLYSRKCTSV